MGALQYVDVPGYSALVLRKTLSDLKLPSALLARAHDWLDGTDAHWVAGEHTFYFPTTDADGKPAEFSKVVFGYLGQELARDRYQSSEFQYVAFDELTHFSEENYTYLFSRIRKKVCPVHKLKSRNEDDPNDLPDPNYVDDCPVCQIYKSLPTRMRAATNPGAPWIKERFRLEPIEDPQSPIGVRYVGKNPEAPFIPATVWDNPHYDQKAYVEGLDKLDAVSRAQLKYGDWGASPNARFKPSWFRRYSIRGDLFFLSDKGSSGTGPHYSRATFSRIFCTLDPAASTREGPGDKDNWRGIPDGGSYTVLSTWGLTPDYHLLWLDVVRDRFEIPDILAALKRNYRIWRPSYYIIESVGLGQGVYQLALKSGLPVKSIYAHQDKLARATDAMIRAEQGRIWLPEHPGPRWLRPLEDELFFWFGNKGQQADQIDTLAYAAQDVSWEASAVERADDPDLAEASARDTPGIIPAPAGAPGSFDSDSPFSQRDSSYYGHHSPLDFL